ncbi:MAG: sigma-70 family RNA polymerase sigma factor [Gemmatales bacterium]
MDARTLFDILAREQSPMLRVYLRCLVQSAEVDDLLQESLVAAWRSLDHYDRDKPLGPWLRGIARHIALAHYRKRTQTAVPYDPEWLQSLEDKCDAVQKQTGDTLEEKLTGLRDCIEQLPEPYRHSIRLRYQQALTGEPLAKALAISMENVKKRLQRARAWLTECMQKKRTTEEGLA